MSYWRDRLRPASFKGVQFHVEVGARAGGRRLAPHEFPKRDTPYVEDMGRKMRGFSITGYLVAPDYVIDRDELIDALEAEGAGLLVHPTFGEFMVAAGPYSVSERRERGAVCEIEMNFLEAGSATPFTIADATQDQVRSGATDLGDQAARSGDAGLGAAGAGNGTVAV